MQENKNKSIALLNKERDELELRVQALEPAYHKADPTHKTALHAQLEESRGRLRAIKAEITRRDTYQRGDLIHLPSSDAEAVKDARKRSSAVLPDGKIYLPFGKPVVKALFDCGLISRHGSSTLTRYVGSKIFDELVKLDNRRSVHITGPVWGRDERNVYVELIGMLNNFPLEHSGLHDAATHGELIDLKELAARLSRTFRSNSRTSILKSLDRIAAVSVEYIDDNYAGSQNHEQFKRKVPLVVLSKPGKDSIRAYIPQEVAVLYGFLEFVRADLQLDVPGLSGWLEDFYLANREDFPVSFENMRKLSSCNLAKPAAVYQDLVEALTYLWKQEKYYLLRYRKATNDEHREEARLKESVEPDDKEQLRAVRLTRLLISKATSKPPKAALDRKNRKSRELKNEAFYFVPYSANTPP